MGVFNSKFFIDKKHRLSFSNNPFPFSLNLTIFDCFSIILTSSYTYFVLIFFFLLNFVKYNFKINSPKKIVCNLTCFYIYLFWLVSIFLNPSRDIEKSPGLKTKSCQGFSICHWNLNSISAHNFSKKLLLQAYNAVHKCDIICLSKTYLNSSIPYDDDNLEIPGCNLIRVDHPSEDKRGGVCIYWKHTLPLKVLDIDILQECINCEIKRENKLCNFIVLHSSPSQAQDTFESFIDNLELNIDAIVAKDPYLIDILCDFNAKLSTWCRSDKSTYEGSRIDGLVSNYCLQQLINELTHRTDISSSCIFFLYQPNLVMESGVHTSLRANCHHQIIYAKFKLKVYYLPPYEREVITKMRTLML